MPCAALVCRVLASAPEAHQRIAEASRRHEDCHHVFHDRCVRNHALRARTCPIDELPFFLDDDPTVALSTECEAQRCPLSQQEDLIRLEEPQAKRVKLAAEDCAICCGGISDPRVVATFLDCRHVFHFACISSYFTKKQEAGEGKNLTCPLCRVNFKKIIVGGKYVVSLGDEDVSTLTEESDDDESSSSADEGLLPETDNSTVTTSEDTEDSEEDSSSGSSEEESSSDEETSSDEEARRPSLGPSGRVSRDLPVPDHYFGASASLSTSNPSLRSMRTSAARTTSTSSSPTSAPELRSELVNLCQQASRFVTGERQRRASGDAGASRDALLSRVNNVFNRDDFDSAAVKILLAQGFVRICETWLRKSLGEVEPDCAQELLVRSRIVDWLFSLGISKERWQVYATTMALVRSLPDRPHELRNTRLKCAALDAMWSR